MGAGVKAIARERFDEGVSTWFFARREVLLVCPKCGDRAQARPAPGTMGGGMMRECRVACDTYGWNLRGEVGFHWQRADGEVNACINDTDRGRDVRCRLWLRRSVRSHTLWAFNYEHLAWMRRYVAATLREQARHNRCGWGNSQLPSKFPKWMSLAKNRRAVLRAITQMERDALT